MTVFGHKGSLSYLQSASITDATSDWLKTDSKLNVAGPETCQPPSWRLYSAPETSVIV